MTQRDRPTAWDIPPDVMRAAELWALRIETSVMDDSAWASFSAWMDEKADHREAFVTIQSWLTQIDRVEPTPSPRRANMSNLTTTVGRRSYWPASLAAGIAGLAIIASASLVWLRIAPPSASPPEVFATADTVRSIKLSDDSLVTLNSHSTLAVAFGAQVRKVSLKPGSEADFDVKHDVSRPFELAAGATQIRVLGTAFDVKYLDDLTRVSVSRGAVRVSDQAGLHTATLTVGQSLAIDAHGGSWRVSEIVDAAPWRSGQLIYDRQSLPEVCADMARATNTQVDLEPSARSLVFSGVLRVTRGLQMAHTLELYLPIRAVEEGGRVKIMRRRGDGAS